MTKKKKEKKDLPPILINYVRGVTQLHAGCGVILKRIMKDIDDYDLDPNEEVPQALLDEFRIIIEKATNQVFSDQRAEEALAEVLLNLILKLGPKG